MMCRVYNDNVYPYTEKFRGKEISIPAKGSGKNYVEMDFNDANLFLGIMPRNIELDAGGLQKPQTYKMLRIVRQEGYKNESVEKEFGCHACGEQMHSQAAYDEHIYAKHSAQIVEEDVQDKLQKRVASKKKIKEEVLEL